MVRPPRPRRGRPHGDAAHGRRAAARQRRL